MSGIYLDCNATTALDDVVFDAILPYLKESFANPSSIHSPGQKARNAVELARIQVAGTINAATEEVFFVSGGTEANNTAIKGAITASRATAKHIVTTPIEHSSVLKSVKHLEESGVAVTEIPVDRHGQVDPDDVRRAIKDSTILVSIGHANNEIGTVQPIDEIASLMKDGPALLHTDAVQSLGKIHLDVHDLGVDLLSLSAHKCYGPKGAGGVYIRRGVAIEPLLHGGSQERRFRAGTENVAHIVGMGKAAQLAHDRFEHDTGHYLTLRSIIEETIKSRIEGVRFHGHPEHRLPQTTNVSFEDVDGLTLVIRLDLLGISVSTGSACSSGSTEVSHVHGALPDGRGTSAIRISPGRNTREDECRTFVAALEEIVKEVRG